MENLETNLAETLARELKQPIEIISEPGGNLKRVALPPGQPEEITVTHHPITVLPTMAVIEAAALATESKGILQSNGKACVIARDLLPGYIKIHATEKKAA